MPTHLVVGTRGSKLALFQTDIVCEFIRRVYPEINLEIRTLKTLGDREPNLNLLQSPGKGVFCGEIEKALLSWDIDMAIHSVKDLPGDLPLGLTLAAYIEREDPREVLVSRDGCRLAALAPGSRIGTSSIRRLLQLKALRPDLEYLPIRGNVETRVNKVMRGDYEATILALAGLRRLDMEDVVSEIFPVETIIPAPGQGCIGVEIREDNEALKNLLTAVDNGPVSAAVRAERAFLHRMGGNCESAAGAYAVVTKGEISIRGLFGKPGNVPDTLSLSGPVSEAEQLGILLAEKLLE